MGEVSRAEKGLVTRVRFARLGRYSLQTYANRWGSWSRALRAFRQWQPEHDPDFPYAEQLRTHRVPGRIPREGPDWTPRGGRQYGEPLQVRGLQHTPVNEMGVLFLFATMANELGFVVESLTPGFPDCEAKRRVGKTWERVRIEFEYQSHNFRDHRHDPQACGLIVCWEHNWEKCPLEVLELKRLVTGERSRECCSRQPKSCAQFVGAGKAPSFACAENAPTVRTVALGQLEAQHHQRIGLAGTPRARFPAARSGGTSDPERDA